VTNVPQKPEPKKLFYRQVCPRKQQVCRQDILKENIGLALACRNCEARTRR